jgi:hypothetical protein
LLHQQYQQHPTNQQTLLGNQTSPQQILPSNQQSQVFSPNQHSPQFFQQSPQSQMWKKMSGWLIVYEHLLWRMLVCGEHL